MSEFIFNSRGTTSVLCTFYVLHGDNDNDERNDNKNYNNHKDDDSNNHKDDDSNNNDDTSGVTLSIQRGLLHCEHMVFTGRCENHSVEVEKR